MSVHVKSMETTDAPQWDQYVLAHPKAVVYQLSGWKKVISKAYGHRTHYLMAFQDVPGPAAGRVNGILPLVHLKHFFFGNRLISMPFFDLGGILADNAEVEGALLDEAARLADSLGANHIELRQVEPFFAMTRGFDLRNLQIHSHKVDMRLKLPAPGEDLMQSFKAKLRNQVLKPIKEGFHVKTGGNELLEDFYHVFLTHMRDLGSPVHSRKLIRYTLEEFPERAKILVVYKDTQPVAGSVVLEFKNSLENPWASALRRYKAFSPNMLLYWSMLDYAHRRGLSFFNFGRSSHGENTYRFKEQWGAQERPLYWHSLSTKHKPAAETMIPKHTYSKAIACWKKLPVPLTKIIGPMIRKHIDL